MDMQLASKLATKKKRTPSKYLISFIIAAPKELQLPAIVPIRSPSLYPAELWAQKYGAEDLRPKAYN